ncbi:MAG: endolytic transglycosylase MltG [Anaerolineae bacterium]|nr:endolytic transglycosylase MltG [Anaerolineae bacterium]
MKQVGRIVIFLIVLGVIGFTIYRVAQFTGSEEGGSFGGVTACSGDSPESLVLESYIELHREDLGRPAGDDDTPVTFVVEPGETAGQIAERLVEAGLVSDAELFRRYLQYEGLDAGLEAGTFTLRQTMTIPEIAQALQSGLRPERVVTVREGLRLEEIAADVAAQTGIPEAEFLELVTTGWRGTELAQYGFLIGLPPDATLEGFLFPDTYRLPEEATAYDVLARMLSTFDERVSSDMRLAAANRGWSVYELVTLASIVEREAVLAAERPIIAGVYLNRIVDGWLLNADPTVQYALGYQADAGSWWKRPLYLVDLEIDSPYNTYIYTGLPPSPICSPGQSSLQAAAAPADTEYYFFLANCHANDGSHLFAATEEEHYANYASCGGEVP